MQGGQGQQGPLPPYARNMSVTSLEEGRRTPPPDHAPPAPHEARPGGSAGLGGLGGLGTFQPGRRICQGARGHIRVTCSGRGRGDPQLAQPAQPCNRGLVVALSPSLPRHPLGRLRRPSRRAGTAAPLGPDPPWPALASPPRRPRSRRLPRCPRRPPGCLRRPHPDAPGPPAPFGPLPRPCLPRRPRPRCASLTNRRALCGWTRCSLPPSPIPPPEPDSGHPGRACPSTPAPRRPSARAPLLRCPSGPWRRSGRRRW